MRLNDKRFDGYLRRAIPHELDEVVDGVVARYRAAAPAGRQALLAELSPRAAAVLNAYAQRMAAVAVRTQAVEVLRRAVVALGMAEVAAEDPTMNLVVLAAVNHSAAALGTDLASVLRELAGALPDPALANFRAFALRGERDRSLQAMGLTATGSGESFHYTSG